MSYNEKKKFILNDHRQLNEKLEYFFFDKNIGQGLPFFLPNAVIVKNIIQNYLRQIQTNYEYQEVISPLLADQNIYEASGH
jgi:threonyl-tRNA synthetase